METTFVFLYPLVSLISICGYLPQIKILLFSNADPAGLSIPSWVVWTIGTVLAMGYGLFHLRDPMFCVSTGVNLTLTSLMTSLLIWRRYQHVGAALFVPAALSRSHAGGRLRTDP